MIFSSTEDSRLSSSMWELVRKYIRCSSRTTIGHIKKYLKLKLKLSAVDQVTISVTINSPIVTGDLSSTFPNTVYDWRTKQYMIQDKLTNTSNPENSRGYTSQRKVKSRSGRATGLLVVKRGNVSPAPLSSCSAHRTRRMSQISTSYPRQS